jgi:spore germination protein GerM
MFRTLSNLCIILLISLIATGISINLCPILDNTTSVVADESSNIVTLSCDTEDKLLINPTEITIKHESTGVNILSFYDNTLLTATIFKDNKIYDKRNLVNLPNKLPYTIELTKDSPHSAVIDISQNKLKLPDGKYKIVISSNAIELKYSIEPITLNVQYQGNSPYIPAAYEAPDNKLGLTLYFADENYGVDQLIGVTRFIDDKKLPLHKLVVKELQKGPIDNIGLSVFPPIEEVNYVVRKNNIVYVDLPSNQNIYNNESSQCYVAFKSFIKSLTSLEEVDRVRFTVDNRVKDTFFHGIKIDKSIKNNMENKAYLAYNSFKRYYLVDCDISNLSDTDSIEDKINKLLQTLKHSNYLTLSNTIPEDVEVLDFDIKNNTLTLNFNEAFLHSFNDNTNLQRLMLDSILFSFTSIDNINYVQILVENNTVSDFAGVDLSKPLARPLYINPEY